MLTAACNVHLRLLQRRQMGGVNKAKEDQHIIQKQIRILENRLDKVCVRHQRLGPPHMCRLKLKTHRCLFAPHLSAPVCRPLSSSTKPLPTTRSSAKPLIT